MTEPPDLRLSSVIDADPTAVTIGAHVRARMEPLGASGYRAPVFELVG